MEHQKKTVKIRYGERTFLLDEDSTLQEFLKSQHLDQLKMIVIRKVDDCLVLNP